jgi:hypothetical protein
MPYCPNCKKELSAVECETTCGRCTAFFGEGSHWRPVSSVAGDARPQVAMGRRLLFAGVVLAVGFPLLVVIAFAAHSSMGCSGGGSSAPVSGCHVLGLEINFPANLATPAFLASFIAVPLGVLLCISGLLAMAVTAWRNHSRPYGIYGPDGKLLTLPAAAAAISQFDRSECENLLGSFGQATISDEPIDALRERCLGTIKSSRAFAG